MATGAQTVHDRTRGRWRRHVVGVGLGVLVVAALIGHARVVHELQTIAGREFVLWPHRMVFGLLFLWGIILVVVARFAPRIPALPTIVALVLLYGGFASLPILSRPLPLLGAWQPRMFTVVGAEAAYEWQGEVLILMGGAMAASAVWGWWRLAQERQPRSEPDGDGPPETVG